MAHVVEGSVQKIGNRVKITARLSRAATNEEVWSKRFGPLELTAVFATQSEIAQAIVGELRGQLMGEAATILPEARQAANRALALEPDLAEAHAASFEAQIAFEFDWRGAEVSARKALALAPSDPVNLCNAAKIALFTGHPDRTGELARQALALDPVNTEAWIALANSFENTGRFAEAADVYRRALEKNPAASVLNGLLSYQETRLGHFEEALALAEREPEPWARRTALALVRWAQKKPPEAEAALRDLIEHHAGNGAYNVAEVYGFRGDLDQAFTWLERAFRQRDGGIGWTKTDTFFNSLHADPRWPVFLKKIGLSDEQLK